MKKALILTLLVAGLLFWGCTKCQKQEDVVVDTLAVDTLAVDTLAVDTLVVEPAVTEQVKPTTNKPSAKPVQKPKPQVNSFDKFLTDYEATVVMWEKKTAGVGAVTPDEIIQIGKKYSEMSKNAKDGDFTKGATADQLARMGKLNLRLLKVAKKVGAKVGGF